MAGPHEAQSDYVWLNLSLGIKGQHVNIILEPVAKHIGQPFIATAIINPQLFRLVEFYRIEQPWSSVHDIG